MFLKSRFFPVRQTCATVGSGECRDDDAIHANRLPARAQRWRRFCIGVCYQQQPWGINVATYIMLSTLTDEGRKTLKERPERLKEVNKEVESMGARVVSQYAVLGGYDFVNIIEAPTNEVMSRISMELGARGTIKVTTLPGMSIESFVDMLEGKTTSGN